VEQFVELTNWVSSRLRQPAGNQKE